MAKTVDELVIEIKADTKQLKKELKQIEGKIRTTGAAGGAAFGSMAGGLSKVKGGAIAAVAGFAAMGIAISKVAQVGSGFEDLKDSLNQVFGSINAGDAALKQVMEFAQTTPFQIEDATKAFIQLKSAGIEPNMKQLQTFADTASVSVDQLGTFEALIRMVQRSASGGMGLEELNMISDKGIDVLGILGEKLQLGKDDIAKYGKTADGAAKMVAALVEGLNEKFGGAMEAKMDNLSTKTSNMTIAFKALADDVFNSGLGDFLKGMSDSLTEFSDSILRARMQARGDIFPNMEGILALEDPLQRMGALQPQIRKVEAQIIETQDKINGLEARGMAQQAKPHEAKLSRLERQLELMTSLNEQLDKEINTPKKDPPVILTDEQIKLQQEFNKLFQDTIPEYDILQIKIDTLNEALKNGTKDAKGNPLFDPEKGAIVLENLRKIQSELGETITFSDEMRQAIISSSQAFTGQFVDALMEGQNALASFKDFARSMVSQIITIFLQLAVVNQILNSIFGLTGDNALPTYDPRKLFGGGKGVTSGAPVFDPMNMPRPKFNFDDDSAGGGTIQGGRATLVGERGPEIFIPNTGGTIMNNMNSKNAMGGGATTVINQSINFATGIVPTVRAEVMQMMPQIANVTKAAVQESAMRGGTFRRSLQGG